MPPTAVTAGADADSRAILISCGQYDAKIKGSTEQGEGVLDGGLDS